MFFQKKRNFVQHQQSFRLNQQFLLKERELLELRAFSEQLDCSLLPQHILESRHTGSLPTRALGSGTDYAESRIYQSGDDIRLINWRLSARSQETFVKTFHIESRPSINVFLDKRRSMIFGTRKRLKVTQAVRIASLLAYASEYHHLLFQGWIVDDENNGIRYFDNSQDFLQQANQAVVMPAQVSGSKTKFSSVFQKMNQCIKKGSLVYFISDFSNLNTSHKSELVKINEQSFSQVIHIQDKAELELPNLGKLRLQDMYQNRSYKLDTKKPKNQAIFEEYLAEQLTKRKTIIKDAGIFYHQLLTDIDDLQNCVYLPLGQA